MECEHCKDTTCSKRKTAGECTRYGTSNIEIPFGAFDSELGGFEYTIPEGFEAEIKDGKVIVRKVDRIRRILLTWFNLFNATDAIFERIGIEKNNIIEWLEKQGERKDVEYSLEQSANIFLDALAKTPYNNKPITDAQVIVKELLEFLNNTRTYNPDALIDRSLESNKKFEDFVRWFVKQRTDNYTLIPSDNDVHEWAVLILKHAKNTIIEQKSIRWSKEDERAIERACATLRAYSNGELPGFLPSELLDYADRLQALLGKLPNVGSWKPSEEQIDALKKVEEIVVMAKESSQENAYLYTVIKSLKEDLYQLKGGNEYESK